MFKHSLLFWRKTGCICVSDSGLFCFTQASPFLYAKNKFAEHETAVLGGIPFAIAKIIPWNKSNQGDKRLSQWKL